MQGSQLAGQKEAPQAHNSIFLLVFARRSSNVAQFRWEGIRFRLSLSSLGSLWLGILATRAAWSPARHMRFACPLYLFVCNYACSKQNPGALDNVTRPHCTPLPPVHFLYLPFPISHFPTSHFPLAARHALFNAAPRGECRCDYDGFVRFVRIRETT